MVDMSDEENKNQSLVELIKDYMFEDIDRFYSCKELCTKFGRAPRAIASAMNRLSMDYPVKHVKSKGYRIIWFDDSFSYDQLYKANDDAHKELLKLVREDNCLRLKMRPLIKALRETTLKMQKIKKRK